MAVLVKIGEESGLGAQSGRVAQADVAKPWVAVHLRLLRAASEDRAGRCGWAVVLHELLGGVGPTNLVLVGP